MARIGASSSTTSACGGFCTAVRLEGGGFGSGGGVRSAGIVSRG
jgi:hypothetical protein